MMAKAKLSCCFPATRCFYIYKSAGANNLKAHKNIRSLSKNFTNEWLHQIKTIVFLSPFFYLFVAAEKLPSSQFLIITNNQSFYRQNEVITIKRALFNNVNKALFPIVKKGDKLIVTQMIDADNDSVWDELLIEVTLEPYSTDTLEITWVEKSRLQVFAKKTKVQLSLRSDTDMPMPKMTTAWRARGFTQNIARPYYQMEGPGIENDNVAFRAFFDYRNSFDIYGKIVDTPVLERVGVGASWHELQPWGMDVFHTGNSLGAGGLAVSENNKIYRLADADTTVFSILYEGALSAAFNLKYKNWDVAQVKSAGSETVSMVKGTFYYKNEINLSLNKFQSLLAGIANFSSDKVVYKKHNTRFSSVSIYGPQAEGTHTNLGVAIMFRSSGYISSATTDTASLIPNTSYVLLKPSRQGKQTIYFFAGWEKTDARFSTQKGFEAYLQQTAQAMAHPIQVKIISIK